MILFYAKIYMLLFCGIYSQSKQYLFIFLHFTSSCLTFQSGCILQFAYFFFVVMTCYSLLLHNSSYYGSLILSFLVENSFQTFALLILYNCSTLIFVLTFHFILGLPYVKVTRLLHEKKYRRFFDTRCFRFFFRFFFFLYVALL